MADIQLRFLKDMLVLSEPVWTGLARLGLNVARDGDLTLLLEPEVFEDAYQLDVLAGAQCLVAPTASLTPARLAHTGMQERAQELAQAALNVVRAQNPQHILVEIGPCGLPLDAASKASLNENADQYKRAAALFQDEEFDAFFLNGFKRIADLKCALIGMRKVTDAPIFASVEVEAAATATAAMTTETMQPSTTPTTPTTEVVAAAATTEVTTTAAMVRSEGILPSGEALSAAAAVMAEYGAQVLGFNTAVPLADAAALTQALRKEYTLPILVQLDVRKTQLKQELEVLGEADFGIDASADVAAADGPYAEPDDMVDAADALRAAGAQFLRAAGDATAAYTGALVAATDDLDAVLPPELAAQRSAADPEPLDDVAARLRAKISKALGD